MYWKSAGAIGNDKIDGLFPNKIQSILGSFAGGTRYFRDRTSERGICLAVSYSAALLIKIQKFNVLEKQDKRSSFQLQNAKWKEDVSLFSLVLKIWLLDMAEHQQATSPTWLTQKLHPSRHDVGTWTNLIPEVRSVLPDGCVCWNVYSPSTLDLFSGSRYSFPAWVQTL